MKGRECTVGDGDGPVLREGSTPDSEVQGLHHDPVENYIGADNLYGYLLLQAESEFVVH